MKKPSEENKNFTFDDLIKKGKITTKTLDGVIIIKSYIEKKCSFLMQKIDEKIRVSIIKYYFKL